MASPGYYSPGSGGPITNGLSPLGQEQANWIKPCTNISRRAGHRGTALAFASPNAGNPEKSPSPNSALCLKLQFAKLFKFAAQTVPQRAFRAKFFQQRFSLSEGLLREFTSSK